MKIYTDKFKKIIVELYKKENNILILSTCANNNKYMKILHEVKKG